MIQRIQSLYLLLVIIAYTLLFFFPIATYTAMSSDNLTEITTRFSLLGITNANSNSTIPLMVAVVLLAIAVLVTIFLYKKRLLQIKITAIVLLAHMGLVVALFYSGGKIGANPAYDAGMYIALIPLVFLVLANRAIRRDEKMVRSTDRLR
ncbi:MAG: DUF4293 domain-containing protein [Bacteroidota bacterium]